jgi:hypothetical protein
MEEHIVEAAKEQGIYTDNVTGADPLAWPHNVHAHVHNPHVTSAKH